jgi:hypothetical protein
MLVYDRTTCTKRNTVFLVVTVAAVSQPRRLLGALTRRGKDTSATIEYNCRLLKNPVSESERLRKLVRLVYN